MIRCLQGGVLRDLQRKWGASRLAEKVAGRVGRVRRVGQLFQEICNARSSQHYANFKQKSPTRRTRPARPTGYLLARRTSRYPSFFLMSESPLYRRAECCADVSQNIVIDYLRIA